MELTTAFISQLGSRFQYLICPFQQFVGRHLEGVNVVASRLIDAESDAPDVIKSTEGIKSTQGIAFKLTVPGTVFSGCRYKNTDTVFQIDDVQQIISHNHTVSGTESVLYPSGEVESLLNAYQRI